MPSILLWLPRKSWEKGISLFGPKKGLSRSEPLMSRFWAINTAQNAEPSWSRAGAEPWQRLSRFLSCVTSPLRTPDNPYKRLRSSRTNLGSFWSSRSGAGRTKWPVFFDAGRIQVRSRGSAGHIGQVQVGQASIKQKFFDEFQVLH